jgi:uncharacterized protein
VQELRISVAEILGRPGASRQITVSEPLEGVQVSLARLDAGAKVAAGLRLESVVEGILATGRASTPVTFECARCLKKFSGQVEAELCELFVTPNHVDPEEDPYRVEGEEIDLEPMLRDALTLALPLNPVCEADCKGICAQCGNEMTSETCDCTQEATDPRWAELDALRTKLEASN